MQMQFGVEGGVGETRQHCWLNGALFIKYSLFDLFGISVAPLVGEYLKLEVCGWIRTECARSLTLVESIKFHLQFGIGDIYDTR